ncbi:MAG: lytic transglycosylase domain-containing protein [Rhizobiales bacterium]|nr:lytic transglycosylase domain-containing protein [Hyphomicrobiales bacterium]
MMPFATADLMPHHVAGKLTAVLVCALLLPCVAVQAAPGDEDTGPVKPAAKPTKTSFIADVCRRIERAAETTALPPAFFARLLWKESRFNPNAVSPKGAMGIAQFMPGTAKLRGLEDPFDATTAIPASARYLAKLRDEFGNLGLAAAAYNAGENRVARWRAGRSSLPAETRDFVVSITGYPAADWSAAKPPKAKFALDPKRPFQAACRRLPVKRHKLQQRYASAPWQPWGVHLAANWSLSRALSQYRQIQRKFPTVLGGLKPMVVREVNYSFGAARRYEIRIGQSDRAKANKFCGRLRQAGGVCIVYKTKKR